LTDKVPIRSRGRYTEADRNYVRYCLRYAVLVLGKRKVTEYVQSLNEFGEET
jgi:hypothetical protein